MYEQGRAKQKLRTQGSGMVGGRVDWGDAQVRGGDSGVMEDAGEGVGRIGVTHLLPKRTGGGHCPLEGMGPTLRQTVLGTPWIDATH